MLVLFLLILYLTKLAVSLVKDIHATALIGEVCPGITK